MWHSRPPPFMANAILNFHFDYWHTSLIKYRHLRFLYVAHWNQVQRRCPVRNLQKTSDWPKLEALLRRVLQHFWYASHSSHAGWRSQPFQWHMFCHSPQQTKDNGRFLCDRMPTYVLLHLGLCPHQCNWQQAPVNVDDCVAATAVSCSPKK